VVILPYFFFSCSFVNLVLMFLFLKNPGGSMYLKLLHTNPWLITISLVYETGIFFLVSACVTAGIWEVWEGTDYTKVWISEFE
jgi:hypothetical protein